MADLVMGAAAGPERAEEAADWSEPGTSSGLAVDRRCSSSLISLSAHERQEESDGSAG